MKSNIIWHATLHEMRVLRRLLRTQVFVCVALLVSTVYFVAVTLSHMYDGSATPMYSVISPRYIMSLLGESFVTLFCIGVLLFTFDQIKRDEITRIHEVMNSKPANDLELLAGRLLGVSITLAVPMIVFLLSIMIYGMIADTFSFRFGEPVELWSVVSFVLLDISPIFVLFGSLVIMLSLWLKSRLLALLLTLGSLFALFWLNSVLPLDVSRPIQTVTGKVLFPSELTPTLFTPMIVFNRIALLLLGVGFLCWSSCVVARTTATRTRDITVGSLCFSCGLVLFCSMFVVQTIEHCQINHWVDVHDEHFNPNAFPDVHKIEGNIDIKPGRSIVLDLALDVSVGDDQDIEFILFSLNPGYHISDLTVAGATVIDHKFKDGLLKIPRHYFDSDSNELKITATGRPNRRFAYLDTVDTLSKIVGPDYRQLRHLGTENAIFRSNFVVLSPGIKWYPTSGTSTNEDAWDLRNRDFFTLDIEVSVPRNWLVAGPATRQTIENNRITSYRFQQTSPLPEFALIGSRFKSASIDLEGISFELLYAQVHRRKFEAFTHLRESIRQSIKQRLDTLHPKGFEYPYGSFVLVEVPSTFRVFGGGLEMDTVMNPPGMVLMRESTMPTTTVRRLYYQDIRREEIENHEITEEQFDRMEMGSIVRYLTNPYFESNLHLGLFRSLYTQQTCASGDGARVLNSLLAPLMGRVSPYSKIGFDFQIASNRDIFNLSSIDPIAIFGSVIGGYEGQLLYDEEREIYFVQNAPEIWDTLESMPLFNPITGENSTWEIRAFKFRAQRLEKLLRDSLGNKSVAPFLVNLTSQFRGRTFDFEEFETVLGDHDVNLSQLAGDLIRTTDLPGFVVSNPTWNRLENHEAPMYEVSFLIENQESVSGPVKFSLTFQNDGRDSDPATRLPLNPILVEANQLLSIVIESSNPVHEIWAEPYLSLNRMNLRLVLPAIGQQREQEFVDDAKPYIKSITEVDQVKETTSPTITVDDLDLGFSIEYSDGAPTADNVFSRFFKRLLDSREYPLDRGIPKYSLVDMFKHSPGWYRWSDSTGFGKYRRTFAIAVRGEGRTFAKFNTTLPEIGPWELEYHLPNGYFHEEVNVLGASGGWFWGRHLVGTIHLEIRSGSTITTKTLAAGGLSPGWQSIGTFDLLEEEVDVLVSSKSDGPFFSVFADAIRWTPVESVE